MVTLSSATSSFLGIGDSSQLGFLSFFFFLELFLPPPFLSVDGWVSLGADPRVASVAPDWDFLISALMRASSAGLSPAGPFPVCGAAVSALDPISFLAVS